ncbi:putative Histidine kinase [Candidatus Terasakiella magnetica]|uniref:histidine kinase n=1 Tax=Candidatus Terasakiella magnetica TaxID=1867952 RepID=A0A1C3RI36_9PROT|nr:ATP-binding protein [Candidatus Terasakiella magnetica]SCA56953.1 putative Histidine kinase [Candidatus Terasakiella magnetica]
MNAPLAQEHAASISTNNLGRKKRLYLLSAIVFGVLITLAAIWDIRTSKALVFKQAEEQARSSSFLVSAWITGSFEVVKHENRALRAKIKPSDLIIPPIDIKRHEELAKFVVEEGKTIPQILSLGYMDDECRVVVGATRGVYRLNGKAFPNKAFEGVTIPIGNSYSYQDFCRGLMDFPEREDYLSKIYEGYTKENTMAYVHRLRDEKGEFVGISAISFTMSFFQQWLNRLDLKDIGVFAITDLEGNLLAQLPQTTKRLHKQKLDEAFFKFLPKETKNSQSETNQNIEGENHILHFERVTGLPFYVVIALEKHALLGAWRGKLYGYSVGLILIWLLIAVSVREHFRTVDQSVQLHGFAMQERSKNEEKARFLAMLSHELKTPLSVIRMVLGANTISDQMRETAEQAVNDMDFVIGRTKDVEQLDAEKIELHLSDCDIVENLNEIIETLAQADRFTIVGGPLAIIESDKHLLMMVLSNLLHNAIKYSDPKKSIILELGHIQRNGVEMVEISIANYPGQAGWPDPDMVFTKYYRHVKAHRITGSGLGLYLVSGLTTLLQGAIEYKPDEELIRFVVRLPLSLKG